MQPDFYTPPPYTPAYQPSGSKQRKMIVVLILLAAIGGIVWFIIYNKGFHLSSTDPDIGSVSTVSPYLKASFNKDLSKKDLSISMKPNAIKTYSVNGRVLTIKFNYPLQLNKQYTLTINAVTSMGGQRITNKVFTFTPQDIPPDDLSEEQQKTLVSDQDQFEEPLKDPLLSHLPNGTLHASLTPVITTDKDQKTAFVVAATITLPVSDITSGEEVKQQAITEYKKEVTDFIASFGLDPAKYTIEYEIVESSRF